MRQDLYLAPNPNFTGEFDLMRNGATRATTRYRAQYRHRFTHGLQALLSYTWSHSIDNSRRRRTILNVPPARFDDSDRGSSDYDIRHTFSGAVSYDIPAPGDGIWKRFWNWSTDSIVYSRTAPPVNVVTGKHALTTPRSQMRRVCSALISFLECRSGSPILTSPAESESTKPPSASQPEPFRAISAATP